MRWSRERGSVSVEMAILTPAFLLLVVLAIAAGRTAIAYNAIDLAAHDAARAASISRDKTTADLAARQAADDALAQQGLRCVGGPQVDPVLAGFDEPVEDLDLAFVSVTVTCEVSFTDVALPGIPDTRTLTTTFVSPLDVYRERT